MLLVTNMPLVTVNGSLTVAASDRLKRSSVYLIMIQTVFENSRLVFESSGIVFLTYDVDVLKDIHLNVLNQQRITEFIITKFRMSGIGI